MKPHWRRVPAVLLLATLYAPNAYGSWLSDITGIDINIPARTVEIRAPRPQAIPEMLRNLPQDIGQLLLAPHGQALATAIRQAAAQALDGSRPIPAGIRATLSRFFPPHILDKARWNVYDGGHISLEGVIFGWFNSEGAVTLDRVIVFRDGATAEADWRLWAHELTHVSQYDNMGVESFATVYSVNWESLENQARQWEQHVAWSIVNEQGQNSPRYQVAPSWSRVTLSSNDYANAAKSVYPAQTCAQTQETPQALFVLNSCPIPILVTGWQQRNPQTGIVYPIQCGYNCWVGPGQNAPFQSPGPGPMVAVFYRY